MTAQTAERMARKGDRVESMVVTGRTGVVWAGEFYTVLGEGRLASFLGQSDRTQLGHVFLTLEDGTVVMTDMITAFRVDHW